MTSVKSSSILKSSRLPIGRQISFFFLTTGPRIKPTPGRTMIAPIRPDRPRVNLVKKDLRWSHCSHAPQPDHSAWDSGFILNAPFSSAECEALPKPYSADGKPVAPIFAKRFENGVFEYMIFDPRLQLLENTVDKPMADGGDRQYLILMAR